LGHGECIGFAEARDYTQAVLTRKEDGLFYVENPDSLEVNKSDTWGGVVCSLYPLIYLAIVFNTGGYSAGQVGSSSNMCCDLYCLGVWFKSQLEHGCCH
jgi:hypothetical protein